MADYSDKEYQREKYKEDSKLGESYNQQVNDVILPRIFEGTGCKIIKLEIASGFEDLNNVTDFILIYDGADGQTRKIGIAFRVWSMPEIFSIRAKRPYEKTELPKLREGKGPPLFLFGWPPERGKPIAKWALLEIAYLRSSGLLDNPVIKENYKKKRGHNGIKPEDYELNQDGKRIPDGTSRAEILMEDLRIKDCVLKEGKC